MYRKINSASDLSYWQKLKFANGHLTDNLAKLYKKNCFRKIVYDNVELDLLRDPRFVSTLVGLGFAFVSDVTYLAMEPMLLFSYGYTKVKLTATESNCYLNVRLLF